MKTKNDLRFIITAVSALLLAMNNPNNMNLVYCSQQQKQQKEKQKFIITEAEERTALNNSSLLIAELFDKLSAAIAPLMIQMMKNPSGSIKEKALSVVDQRVDLNLFVPKQNGKQKISSWNNLLSDILKGFFPKENAKNLRKENSALGNIIDGAYIICNALDNGAKNKKAVENGVKKIREGLNRLKTEYLRGKEARIETPRAYALSKISHEQSPREAIISGFRKILMSEYLPKLNSNSIHEGINIMIDGILRLNYQHLCEGE